MRYCLHFSFQENSHKSLHREQKGHLPNQCFQEIVLGKISARQLMPGEFIPNEADLAE